MTDERFDQVQLTRNQELVFAALRATPSPMSAYSILDQLRNDGIRAPLQVYRALDKLLEMGIIHRLESMNAFVACQQPRCCQDQPTAFAICESCGAVDEMTDDELAQNCSHWPMTPNSI